MSALVHALLHGRAADLPAARLLALSAASSALFGAAFGAYAGRFQILWNAAKMPLFFLGTLAVSFAALHVFAARELRARETFAAALETIAVTATVLGALAPVVLLFALSAPHEDGAYRFLILLLTGSVAAAGVAGVARLHTRLRSALGSSSGEAGARLRSIRLSAAWVLIYQFTGAQMAWLLKPWVSHTFRDDRFLPLRENLKGNFYESVLGILGRLAS